MYYFFRASSPYKPTRIRAEKCTKNALSKRGCTKPICLPKRAFSRTRRLFGGRTKSERQVSLSNWRGWWQTSPVPRVLLEVYFRTSATFVKEASELTQKSVIKTASNSTKFNQSIKCNSNFVSAQRTSKDRTTPKLRIEQLRHSGRQHARPTMAMHYLKNMFSTTV